MFVRFDLPGAQEEFEEAEEAFGKPCFPYPGLDGRSGCIDMWLPLPVHHLIRLNLKVMGPVFGKSGKKQPRRTGRKVLLRINC